MVDCHRRKSGCSICQIIGWYESRISKNQRKTHFFVDANSFLHPTTRFWRFFQKLVQNSVKSHPYICWAVAEQLFRFRQVPGIFAVPCFDLFRPFFVRNMKLSSQQKMYFFYVWPIFSINRFIESGNFVHVFNWLLNFAYEFFYFWWIFWFLTNLSIFDEFFNFWWIFSF